MTKEAEYMRWNSSDHSGLETFDGPESRLIQRQKGGLGKVTKTQKDHVAVPILRFLAPQSEIGMWQG